MALGKAGEYRANAPGILYLESNHLWWLRNQHRGEITVSIHGGSPATDSLRARVREAALEAARSTALEYCNRVRRRMGLPSVGRMKALEIAAQGHAEYLAVRDAQGHEQEPGTPGFTGTTAQQRQRAAGYDGPGGEVVAYEDTVEAAVEMWLASVYHRLFLTDPALRAIGFGIWGRTQVLNYAVATAPRTDQVVCYPTDGQQQVPVSWNGLESPSPLPTGAEKPVGYTVSAHFPTAIRRVEEAVLRGPDDEPVACYQLSSATDKHLRDRNAVFLLPRSPLRPGVTYRALVVVETAAGKRRAEWSFTTAATSLR
jgi:uncharacterized protein YkwD